ncbi:MAG: TolC family protein [Smithellaceae bacterium]|nr:TolC family protein [Smithellaceae bacterium]
MPNRDATYPAKGSPRSQWIAWRRYFTVFFFLGLAVAGNISGAFAEELVLEKLVIEARKNNPEILALEARGAAARFKIPQAKSLPDPMVMAGYQNEGARYLYTFGTETDMGGSQWMFSASQMFPYPGKLPLKAEMATRDAETIEASAEALRLKIVSRVKELYWDILLSHKNISLIQDRIRLFAAVEDAAYARYSTGMAPQQELLMAQTERYMLREKELMLRQKLQAFEAMMTGALGRKVNGALGKPGAVTSSSFNQTIDELVRLAHERSPEVKSREKMLAGAEAKVKMAQREYYPDITVTANYYARSSQFPDMWSVTTQVNIPIFYKTKQKESVNEARASLTEAQRETEGIKLMITSAIRDNHSMILAADKLMELYKDGLIPKTERDFEAALAGYRTGRVEAITVISRLKFLLEYETLYWGQYAEREKAIARLESITADGLKSSVERSEKETKLEEKESDNHIKLFDINYSADTLFPGAQLFG